MEPLSGETLTIRPAVPADVPAILSLICELAEYENLSHEVVATEELLQEWLFEKKRAEVLIAELNGEPVASALFFHNFSTFLGRAGLYLEDLYVRPGFRGRGIGTKIFRHLARLAVERGCGRLEWACLDWNENSIAFYRAMGAKTLDDWTVYRLDGDTLTALAQEQQGTLEKLPLRLAMPRQSRLFASAPLVSPGV